MKREIATTNALYPSLTTIVGADVDTAPNFLAVAHVGCMNHGQPQYLSIGLSKAHFTNAGILQYGEFSINIPSRAMMVEADYVGLVSGRNTDKSKLFTVSRGVLDHAPMVAECPVSIECRLEKTFTLGKHEIFIGEIVRTWADEQMLDAEGRLDPLRIDPLLFDMNTLAYYALGPKVGDCWNIGKKLKGGTPSA